MGSRATALERIVSRLVADILRFEEPDLTSNPRLALFVAWRLAPAGAS
jgi:hypothetical protein